MRNLNLRILVFFCACLILAAVAVSCSEEEETTGDTATSAQGLSPSVAPAATEAPLPSPAPEPGQPPVEEQPAPYGEGSTASQAVGVTVDGMRLNDVRWGDHGNYFRIVFDMGTPEGEPVLQVPHAEASLSEDGKTITVILSGIRSIAESGNASASGLAVGDSLVASIERIPAMDDQALVYEIRLTRKAEYSLAGLGSPGRIVIDVSR